MVVSIGEHRVVSGGGIYRVFLSGGKQIAMGFRKGEILEAEARAIIDKLIRNNVPARPERSMVKNGPKYEDGVCEAYVCPVCRSFVGYIKDACRYERCHHCGKKLDWRKL